MNSKLPSQLGNGETHTVTGENTRIAAAEVIELKGGTLEIGDNSMNATLLTNEGQIIARKNTRSRLVLNGCALAGPGSLKVEEGATLTVNLVGENHWHKGSFVNEGTMEWKDSRNASLKIHAPAVFTNRGELDLSWDQGTLHFSGTEAAPIRFENNGSIIFRRSSDSVVESEFAEFSGEGMMVTEQKASLSVTVTGQSHWRFSQFVNHGTTYWKGVTGNHINLHAPLVITNHGEFRLLNQDDKLYSSPRLSWEEILEYISLNYPAKGARFQQEAGVLGGAGLLNADLRFNGGEIDLFIPPPIFRQNAIGEPLPTEKATEAKSVEEVPDPGKLTPVPSPSYIVVTGNMATTSGTMTVNINASYYGQLSVGAPYTLNGSTLNVVPNNYTIMNSNVFVIIRCTDVRGTGFGGLLGHAPRFSPHPNIVPITGGESYVLKNYV